MNTICKIFVTLFILTFSLLSFAQSKDEITLTVSSDGSTKDEATKNALRNAIEQSFGAFVSANTTMLNDEVVKDEIVTISNGSIKEYKEISAFQTENEKYFVTLTATVSLPHLITYAKSHGSECEFAGNTFAMNEKIKQMQYENIQKVLQNLKETILNMKNVFDYELILDEPQKNNDGFYIEGLIKIKKNNNTLSAVKLMNYTIKEICKQFEPVGGWLDITFKDTGTPISFNAEDPNKIWLPYVDPNTWRTDTKEYTVTGQYNWSEMKYLRQNKWFDGNSLLEEHLTKFQISDNISSPTNAKVIYDINSRTPILDTFEQVRVRILIIIPQSQISKYSKFWIESR